MLKWRRIRHKLKIKPFGLYVKFLSDSRRLHIGPRGYKTFFMLNSVEHDFFPANKSQITI